jgi:hypothetical protein
MQALHMQNFEWPNHWRYKPSLHVFVKYWLKKIQKEWDSVAMVTCPRFL